jgi:hypothetical protein
MKSLAFLPAALLAVLAGGCQPDIGDPCRLPSDCALGGDRICDTTFSASGYCTIFNCEPGGCPEEAVCVSYQGVVSAVEGCQIGQRLQRTFCMKACEDDGDCRVRDGFACIDLSGQNPWSARVVERDSRRQRVCAIPYTGPLIPEDRSGDVCSSTSEDALPERLPRTPESPVDAGEDGARGDGSPGLQDGAFTDAPEAGRDTGLPDGRLEDGSGEASAD